VYAPQARPHGHTALGVATVPPVTAVPLEHEGLDPQGRPRVPAAPRGCLPGEDTVRGGGVWASNHHRALEVANTGNNKLRNGSNACSNCHPGSGPSPPPPLLPTGRGQGRSGGGRGPTRGTCRPTGRPRSAAPPPPPWRPACEAAPPPAQLTDRFLEGGSLRFLNSPPSRHASGCVHICEGCVGPSQRSEGNPNHPAVEPRAARKPTTADWTGLAGWIPPSVQHAITNEGHWGILRLA